MASMRVHELAKEFDMSSGDLLDRLKEMKIPAKSHASMLNDAYVDKIRKNLEPEIRARAGALEAEEAAALAAEQEQLTERIARLQREYDALTLALDALGRANDSLQTRFSPRINELAARYMSRLTGGLNLGGLF